MNLPLRDNNGQKLTVAEIDARIQNVDAALAQSGAMLGRLDGGETPRSVWGSNDIPDSVEYVRRRISQNLDSDNAYRAKLVEAKAFLSE
jgi:hypothetical protein